ncbi:MAG: IclR family transcriptional regulator [Hyphomonadaceae bacterium]
MSVRAIKSAERTLALFELFSVRESRLTVGEAARELGIPQPSASMLLRYLADLGYLDYQRATRTFGPTIRVLLLGSWISQRFREAGGLATSLEEFQQAIGGETVFFAIQNGPALQYIASIETERPGKLRVSAGMLRTLTCSAGGRALLSTKSDEEVRGWLRRCNAEAKEERLRVRDGEFMRLMQRVRAQGYATTEGDSIPGVSAIAAPMPSPLGDMALALGAGGPSKRIAEKRETIIAALKRIKTRSELGAAAKP